MPSLHLRAVGCLVHGNRSAAFIPVASTLVSASKLCKAGPRMEYLKGWKELAAYMSRGVRTVQRWEKDLGLPVHRPKRSNRGAVVAVRGEVDAWLHRTPVRAQDERPLVRQSNGEGDAPLIRDSVAEVLAQQQVLWQQSRILRQMCRSLRQEHISTRLRNHELRSALRNRIREIASTRHRNIPA